jgi:transketolase
MENENFIKTIRSDIIEMSFHAKVGHIPSALSMCDYLSIVFQNGFISPNEYKIILGKPFGAQAYYSIFARRGWLDNLGFESHGYKKYGNVSDINWRYIIQREHPLITYIDETMGNSLSVACGIALTGRKVYVNISDASLQEGTVWESIMFASAKKLNSIIMTIDNNNMQAKGRISDINDIEPLADKMKSFGWDTAVCDGHNILNIERELHEIIHNTRKKPTVIIFKTVKGKGISFMENNFDWHYKILDDISYKKAIEELS